MPNSNTNNNNQRHQQPTAGLLTSAAIADVRAVDKGVAAAFPRSLAGVKFCRILAGVALATAGGFALLEPKRKEGKKGRGWSGWG